MTNIGPSLPNLLATVAGNLFELRYLSGLRLTTWSLPAAISAGFPGPQFGIAGTRRFTGVFDRPIIGTIVKPSVGLYACRNRRSGRTTWRSRYRLRQGRRADGQSAPFALVERVKAVMRVVNGLADRTGRKVMFAFNISDQLDRMLGHHDGGRCRWHVRHGKS